MYASNKILDDEIVDNEFYYQTIEDEELILSEQDSFEKEQEEYFKEELLESITAENVLIGVYFIVVKNISTVLVNIVDIVFLRSLRSLN